MSDLLLSEKYNWEYYLKHAYIEAVKSPDSSTQNGALLLNPYFLDEGLDRALKSKDHNRFPDGVKCLDERWGRPSKYKFIEHAERNAIFKAARRGLVTADSVMVCPWAACSDCARAIIQSGVSVLVTHKQSHDKSPPFWQEEINYAFQMFKEAGIKVEMFDGKIKDAPTIMHSGKKWNPGI